MRCTRSPTRENILEMLADNGFADLVDGKAIHASQQEQLDRAFRLACECGYLDLVQKLHRDGAQIRGNPEPLCTAADFDELQIAKYLIVNGADLNAPAKKLGQTPLMDAAGSASLRVLQYLLQRGADTTARCDAGMTALDWANMGRHSATLPAMRTENGVLTDYDTIIELLTSKEIAK